MFWVAINDRPSGPSFIAQLRQEMAQLTLCTYQCIDNKVQAYICDKGRMIKSEYIMPLSFKIVRPNPD
jgi:hypothetical protein